MKLLSICVIVLLGGMTLAKSQTPASPIASPNLTALAFLTKHEWEAKLPDSPDGKTRKIHAQFTWSQSGQVIRISNQFMIDGKARPYLDGLYAWDPQQRVIVFCYVDAEGALTRGRVRSEDAKLVHEFEQIRPDGKSAAYLAKVTPHGEEAWENGIFERQGTNLKPMVKVRYEIADHSF